MTNQNNAAQAAKPQTVLSFDERERILCQFIREPINHDREMAIAIETAVLSKLRAPIADERAVETFAERFALALKPVAYTTKRGAVYRGKSTRVGSENLCTISQAVYEFRAALASAPVAGEAQRRGKFLPEHVTQQMIWNVQSVIEAECNGLALDTRQARNVMSFLMSEHGPDAAPQASAEAFDFVAHLARQAEFSARTFGPGARVAGVCDHIRKELIEVETSGGDLKEWVDVIILGLDGAWRSGATPQEIIAAIVAKQAKNEARTWPDWRTMGPNKAIEHQRNAAPRAYPSGDGSLRNPCPAHPEGGSHGPASFRR